MLGTPAHDKSYKNDMTTKYGGQSAKFPYIWGDLWAYFSIVDRTEQEDERVIHLKLLISANRLLI